MSDESSISSDMPTPELKKLRRLRLENPSSLGIRPMGTLVSGLLQGAPVLRTLEMKGIFEMDDESVVYQNITHLSLTFAHLAIAARPVLEVLGACVNLSDLTYICPFLCHVNRALGDIFSCVFQPHRQDLRSLRLEPEDGPFCGGEESLLDEIDVSSSLEYLSISSTFFARKQTEANPGSVSNLLENLPRNIRTLDIRKEYDIINPKIVELVRQHHFEGHYPQLEELRLRIPQHVYLQPDQGIVPGLAEACDEAGIKLSITRVDDMCDETQDDNCPCSRR